MKRFKPCPRYGFCIRGEKWPINIQGWKFFEALQDTNPSEAVFVCLTKCNHEAAQICKPIDCPEVFVTFVAMHCRPHGMARMSLDLRGWVSLLDYLLAPIELREALQVIEVESISPTALFSHWSVFKDPQILNACDQTTVHVAMLLHRNDPDYESFENACPGDLSTRMFPVKINPNVIPDALIAKIRSAAIRTPFDPYVIAPALFGGVACIPTATRDSLLNASTVGTNLKSTNRPIDLYVQVCFVTEVLDTLQECGYKLFRCTNESSCVEDLCEDHFKIMLRAIDIGYKWRNIQVHVISDTSCMVTRVWNLQKTTESNAVWDGGEYVCASLLAEKMWIHSDSVLAPFPKHMMTTPIARELADLLDMGFRLPSEDLKLIDDYDFKQLVHVEWGFEDENDAYRLRELKCFYSLEPITPAQILESCK